jgi:hypothetical protein
LYFLSGDLDFLVLGFDFLALGLGFLSPDLEIRARFRPGDGSRPGDRISSPPWIAWVRTSFREILPIAEQAMNDYALFAICLRHIAILDSTAAS